MLRVHHLSLSYQKIPILHHLSFDALQDASSKRLGIVGPSGSGKTSLLRSLIALFSSHYDLKADTLQIGGMDVLKLSSKALRSLRCRVGFVSADLYGSFYPLKQVGDVFDEILSYHHLYAKRERKMRSFEMMERLGLLDLDWIWHSFIRELSGGMARRVQLALALVCQCEYLLCDEITGSLDEENAQMMIALLRSLEIPLVFATHQMAHLQSLCDEVLVLEKGRVIDKLSKDQFFANLQSPFEEPFGGSLSC